MSSVDPIISVDVLMSGVGGSNILSGQGFCIQYRAEGKITPWERMAACDIESSNGGHQDEHASGCGIRSGFTLEVELHFCLMWAERRELEREEKVLAKDMRVTVMPGSSPHKSEQLVRLHRKWGKQSANYASIYQFWCVSKIQHDATESDSLINIC